MRKCPYNLNLILLYDKSHLLFFLSSLIIACDFPLTVGRQVPDGC